MEIGFIKGKGLITKNIEDKLVGGYFEISPKSSEKMAKHLTSPLELTVTLNGADAVFDAVVDRDTNNYLQVMEEHSILKLAIVLPQLEIAGVIIAGELKLKIK